MSEEKKDLVEREALEKAEEQKDASCAEEAEELSREEELIRQITLYGDLLRGTVRRGIILSVLFLALLVYRIIVGVDWRTWVAVALIIVSALLSVLLYRNTKKQKDACERELAKLTEKKEQ
ncbi:MAG: hypothetical protein IJF71_00215 [Clostridia bacterium]|nr:hypothetical protein [Clostridia bacterium]